MMLKFNISSKNLVIKFSKHFGQSLTSAGRLPAIHH